MRSRRRLAPALLAPALLSPVVLVALAACSDGPAPEPDASPSVSAPTGAGQTTPEPPTPDDQRAALASAGDATDLFAGEVTGGASQQASVADVAAGSYAPRVVCTSADGAPVTVTVVAAGAELASYEAPCVPLIEGGATMADGSSFDVPGGALDVTVAAVTDAVVAVGLVPAG